VAGCGGVAADSGRLALAYGGSHTRTRATEAWPATRAGIERRLREIRAHASALAEGDATGERAEARVTLETILSREEFKQSPSAAWRERWQKRIGEWLQDFWSRFGGPRLAGPTIARGFAWIAAVGPCWA
jgi:hypothetical protein